MMKFVSLLQISSLAGLVATADAQLPKILGLHGGGGSATGMSSEASDLVNSLNGEFEFVFASIGAFNTNEVWWADPPSKDQPTTDPNHASAMVAALDDIVAREGPFYAIMGYSQGAAAVPVYLSNVPSGTFQKAIMFCGYLPTTHTGLVDRIQQQSPFGDISALVWMGATDSIISNSMSDAQAAVFTNPTVVVDPYQGHVIPRGRDSTYQSVLGFIRGTSNEAPMNPPTNPSTDPPTKPSTDPPTNSSTDPPTKPDKEEEGSGNAYLGDKEEVTENDYDWGKEEGNKYDDYGDWDKEEVTENDYDWGKEEGNKYDYGDWSSKGGHQVKGKWNKNGMINTVQPKSYTDYKNQFWSFWGR